MGHLAVVALDEVPLLRVELELVELVVDRLDAPVELRVELDGVLVRRHQGRELSSIAWISGVASADDTV